MNSRSSFLWSKGLQARKGLAVFLSLVLLLVLAAPLPFVKAERQRNLLAGKQPIQAYVSGGSYNLATKALDMSWYSDGKTSKPTVQQLAGLTNGVEDTAKENSLYFSNSYYNEKRALVLVYDLGEEQPLSEIKVIGETGNDRLGEVRLYAGNTFDSSSNDGRKDLFDAAHRVDTFGTDGVDSDTGVVQQALTGVSARYVAFVIMQGVAVETARDNQAWVRELAVYETAEAAQPQGDNLLAGKQPLQTYLSGGSFGLEKRASHMSWYVDGVAKVPTVQQLAGLTNGVEDTAKENSLYFSNDYYGQKRALILVYDLGEALPLSEIRVIGETGNDRLGGVQLYAGDAFEVSNDTTFEGRNDLFTHRVDTFGTDSGVDSSDGEARQKLTDVTARYVAFVITQGVAVETARDNQAWVRELAVYGVTEMPAEETPLTNWEMPQLRLSDKPGIRFGFDLKVSGIGYAAGDGSYEAAREAGSYVRRELDENSQIVVDGESYVVKDFGAVLSASKNATAEALVCGATDISVSQVSAQNLYNVQDGVVSFTAVVVNIPENMADRTIFARSYVAYEVDGAVQYLYGDVVSTSLKTLQDQYGIVM